MILNKYINVKTVIFFLWCKNSKDKTIYTKYVLYKIKLQIRNMSSSKKKVFFSKNMINKGIKVPN